MLAILGVLSLIAIPIGIVIAIAKGGFRFVELIFTSKLGLFFLIVLTFPFINWACGIFGLDSEEIAFEIIVFPFRILKWIFGIF